jgi:hypothetical protein
MRTVMLVDVNDYEVMPEKCKGNSHEEHGW